MPEKLLENDFWTVNLNNILTTQKATDSTESSKTSEKSSEQGTSTNTTNSNESGKDKNTAPITDWDDELARRIEANEKMDKESQISSYKIETEFFTEFFTAFWKDPELVKRLMNLDDLLRKAFKILGFKKKTNPIFSFLHNSYVQKNLLQPGLINSETFTAIYNAVAKKLVSKSQFSKLNDYNIIYCRDLYTKSATEIEKYLELQSKILRYNADSYEPEDQENNLKVFINIPKIKEQNPEKRAKAIQSAGDSLTLITATSTNAKLNPLNIAVSIRPVLTKSSTVEDDNAVAVSDKELASIVEKLNTPAQMFAALLALSLNTNNADITNLLSNKSFAGLAASDIAKGTQWLTTNKVLQSAKLTDKTLGSFAELLTKKLRDLV